MEQMMNARPLNNHLDFEQLVAVEKLEHMHNYSKSSTIATILAPLLCIPLYFESSSPLIFKIWLMLMMIAVAFRYLLIDSIKATDDTSLNLLKLNMAIAIVTLMWGSGWYVFVQPSDMVSYLLYQIISLTVLFVGMVGYCVDWKAFFSFVIPLKLPEFIFIVLHYDTIVWPIAMGSMIAFYLALKMGFLFAKSWEKAFSLRLRNDALFDQLIKEKNASQAANTAKSEFIATASHDLRQPMQSINIFIEMIDTRDLNEKYSSIFNRMRKSIVVLNRMFNTLLDISKLDSNFSINERLFTSQEIVINLEDNFRDICEEKGIQLEFQHDLLKIKGDSGLIEQILRNLLSNAIQYTETGKITVLLTEVSGLLQLSVKDSGCGIPEEEIPLIFKEFYRSEHSRSQHDGLGLGLSIVNRITRKINGECEVQSQLGKGSTFTIHTSFPAHRLDGSNLVAPPNPAGHLGPKPDNPEVPETRFNLGVIENDDALQSAYQQYFSNAGYLVHTIPHRPDLFEKDLESMPKPDFILSDFRLEENDGIYFIQRLREEFNHEIPACIVTADTSPKHLKLFHQNNIHVMYKPIDIKTIESFILKHIRK